MITKLDFTSLCLLSCVSVVFLYSVCFDSSSSRNFSNASSYSLSLSLKTKLNTCIYNNVIEHSILFISVGFLSYLFHYFFRVASCLLVPFYVGGCFLAIWLHYMFGGCFLVRWFHFIFGDSFLAFWLYYMFGFAFLSIYFIIFWVVSFLSFGSIICLAMLSCPLASLFCLVVGFISARLQNLWNLPSDIT